MENILLLKFLLQPVRFWKSPSKVDVSECGSCDELEWKCMSLSVIVFNEVDLFSEGVSQFSGFHHVLHTVSAFAF